MDDIFIKIINREIPAEIVYENEHTLAFLNIRPDSTGHTLVVPKKPARNIFDADEESVGEVMKTAQKVAQALRETVGAEGINIIVNNEKVAGQQVFYFHVHVIPRREGDGLHYGIPQDIKTEEFSITGEKIRKALG